MTLTIPTFEPAVVVAGDTLKWRKSLRDFSAVDGWVLGYRIVTGTGTDISFTGVADGAGWLITVAMAVTAAIAAGTYRWFAYVTNAGASERYAVDEGYVEFLPNPATVTLAGTLTHNATVLALLKTALEGRVTSQHDSYSVGNRSISKTPMTELPKWIGIYEHKVWKERNPGQIGSTVNVGFAPAQSSAGGRFRQNYPYGPPGTS